MELKKQTTPHPSKLILSLLSYFYFDEDDLAWVAVFRGMYLERQK
jgi:hypothetical protein